ncbi:hypothetical protein NC653_017532 [Populus alba x Populus x berolinensis]|uniref:Uncharacterized protein n=1 Tax=Populus alba x Populus x berolinensis TaxID=444605 RepID=A0AAD6W0M9_9ROSI|nr:hypothetical protein NC653_017532 [Populus alba x Populus x berolinensis]
MPEANASAYLSSLLFSPGQILRWKCGLLEGSATEKQCDYFNSVLFGIIFLISAGTYYFFLFYAPSLILLSVPGSSCRVISRSR